MGWGEVAQLASKADVDAVAAEVAGKAPAVHTHTKSDVGLGNVDNTRDVDKPVSTAQAAALAPKTSPTFTGTVTAPAVKLTAGAGAGKVLTSAADGTASWADPAPAGAPGVVVNGRPIGTAPIVPTATGQGSMAIGTGSKVATTASETGSMGHIAIGDGASVNVTTSHHGSVALGRSASSEGQSVAVGGSAQAATQGSALGYNAKATGQYSTAFGIDAAASASFAVAVGRTATASSEAATAVGRSASAKHSYSSAIGYQATTTADSQVMLGSPTHTVVAPNKLQIGPDGALAVTLFTRTNGSGKTELVAQNGANIMVLLTFP